MAEGVVSEIAVKLLEVLVSHVGQEIKSIFGVKDEIEKLTDTVSTIKDVLVGAENKPVSELLRRLKDALYDADDLLDDFATQLKQREVMTGSNFSKEVRIFFSSSNQIAYSLEVSRKIKAVWEKLENIKKDKEFYDLSTPAGERVHNNTSKREETYSRLPKLVIGRDDDKNKIIKRLLETNDVENVSFIPIVGMGGLGKTTLAKLVYNDEQVKNHFELRMWVCVSDQFHVKVIVGNIIESATKKKPEDLQMEQLQELLHESIDGKKYLLVLDDIWNEDPIRWTQLKDLLINDIKGSKILVTTRSQLAAEIINKHLSHNLEGLDKEKSWSLFRQIAFENGIEPVDSKQLLKIGEEIVEKCRGIPLSISAIGSALNGNITEDYWSRVRDNDMFEISQKEGGVLSILKFSYYHLPSHLKQCFAYCALFPKDFEIERQKLISLWMAQGFLQSSKMDQCVKDVGNKYFMDLLMRSFFQDPEYDHNGNLIYCKMHDLMHDLAQSVAGVECTLTTLETNDSMHKRCRHLSLVCADFNALWRFPNALLGVERIRTLLLFGRSYVYYNDHHKILSTYGYLRALDISSLGFQRLSSSIGKLRHLRYLNLSGNYKIEKLPNSISMLKNLETLDLSHCIYLRQLPKGTRKMMGLKDLIVEGCRSLMGMPHGVGVMNNLQTLSMFVVSREYKKYGALEELCGLNNLMGSLTITNLEDVDNARSANYLESMQFLGSLDLRWQRILRHEWRSQRGDRAEVVLEGLKPHPNLKEIRIEDFMGVKLSSWLSSITNLSSITLECCPRCKYFPDLDELPSLKSMHLWKLDDLEYISDKPINYSSTTFFPSLEELTLIGCPKLKGWWRRDDDDGAANKKLPTFACLSMLKIIECPNLTSMPSYPSVEQVTLEITSGKPLQQTMIMVNSEGASTSSSLCGPLSKLKTLSMQSIDDAEYISASDSCSFAPTTTLFPSLKKLTLITCRNLKGWWRRDDPSDGPTKQMTELPMFSCLSILEIEDCPKLTSMPLFPSLEELQLIKTSSKPLQQTMMMENSVEPSTSTSNNFSAPLSKLKSLYMESIDDLECLPEDGLRNLTSLVDITIWFCPRLSQLFLTSPQNMEIGDCEEDMKCKWQGLNSLRSLRLNGLPKLESLSANGLQFFTTLQDLRIIDCENLKALPESMPNLTLCYLYLAGLPKLVSLPEWLQFLTTLRDLRIRHCPKLKALPESMPNLKRLGIIDCPQLSENCRNNKGKDWPKIAHIPYIFIDGDLIQEEGCYMLTSGRDADED